MSHACKKKYYKLHQYQIGTIFFKKGINKTNTKLCIQKKLLWLGCMRVSVYVQRYIREKRFPVLLKLMYCIINNSKVIEVSPQEIKCLFFTRTANGYTSGIHCQAQMAGRQNSFLVPFATSVIFFFCGLKGCLFITKDQVYYPRKFCYYMTREHAACGMHNFLDL